jgi:hypothetical protein
MLIDWFLGYLTMCFNYRGSLMLNEMGKCSWMVNIIYKGFWSRKSWPLSGSCSNSHLEIVRITEETSVRNNWVHASGCTMFSKAVCWIQVVSSTATPTCSLSDCIITFCQNHYCLVLSLVIYWHFFSRLCYTVVLNDRVIIWGLNPGSPE